MDTENNYESKRLRLRIARGAVLVALGGSLMSRLPQLLPGQQELSWYQSPFTVVGIIIVFIGLVILFMPSKYWRYIWHSVLGLPRWLRETYIWRIWGPVCTLDNLQVTFGLSQDGQWRIYTGKVSLSICLLEKTRNYYPVRVVVNKDTTMFYLEQKRGLVKLPRAALEVVAGTTREILLNTPGKTTHEMVFSWCSYNNPSIAFIDIQQPPYECIIEGIEVHLTNITKFRKLSKRGKVSNVEKA